MKTTKKMENYLLKETEIRSKYVEKINRLKDEISELEALKIAELEKLAKSYPKEFLEDSKVTPCFVWQGKRQCGQLGHECLRIFLVKEDIIKKTSKTGKETEKRIFLYKNYINIFTAFQQGMDGRKFMSDAEIFQHPIWVRLEQCSGNFETWDKESHYYLKNRKAITADLFASICDFMQKHGGEGADVVRDNIVKILNKDGIFINIDPNVNKPSKTEDIIDDEYISEDNIPENNIPEDNTTVEG